MEIIQIKKINGCYNKNLIHLFFYLTHMDGLEGLDGFPPTIEA